jgi:hypothetical protein
LCESDDPCVSTAAVRIVAFVALHRLVPVESFTSEILTLLLLTEEELRLLEYSKTIPGVAISKEKLNPLKAKLLDVLLAICDLDADGVTIKKMDDACTAKHNVSLRFMLEQLPRRWNSSMLQVASLHLMGHFALAAFPRVSLGMLCQIAIDTFRLAEHEMCRAAAASMLSCVAVALKTKGTLETLSQVDLQELHSTAVNLGDYVCRGRDECAAAHQAAIRAHGRCILDCLKSMSNDTFRSLSAENVTAVMWKAHPLNIWSTAATAARLSSQKQI